MFEYLIMRVWSNGRIPPCQGEGTGSIPVTRLLILNLIKKISLNKNSIIVEKKPLNFYTKIKKLKET